MSRELIGIIKADTERLLYNVEVTLKTCDLNVVLCKLPVWKHTYHMLHSLDQWFINPRKYREPDFHSPGLNSLNQADENALSQEDLLNYFYTVKQKILTYLDSLTDEQLSENPEDCEFTRLTLILGGFRHASTHLGNINGTTIIETGGWPRCIGIEREMCGDVDDDLWEYEPERATQL